MKALKLGEICKLHYGKALREYESIPNSDLPVRVYGTNGPIGWTKNALYNSPTIIIGRKGAYRGVHYSHLPSWTIDTAYYLTLINDDVNLKWLYYRLLQLNINHMDSGAAIPSTKREDFYSQPIKIPDLNTQIKIADILSNYDKIITNNQRRIQLLEKSARLLYKEWFVHMRFPGHEHTKFIDGVPEGWKKKKLKEIAHIKMGQSPKSTYYNEEGEGLPFHQGVSNFGTRFPTHKIYCTLKKRVAEPGEILFSVRAPVGRMNIANDKIVLGRGLAAIQSKNEKQSILYYALKNYFFKEDIMGSGAIFAAITKKDLDNVELYQPPKYLENLFEEYVEPIESLISCLNRNIERLTRARDLLLPRLMNGEVEI